MERAVKIIKKKNIDDPKEVQRFQDEVNILEPKQIDTSLHALGVEDTSMRVAVLLLVVFMTR